MDFPSLATSWGPRSCFRSRASLSRFMGTNISGVFYFWMSRGVIYGSKYLLKMCTMIYVWGIWMSSWYTFLNLMNTTWYLLRSLVILTILPMPQKAPKIQSPAYPKWFSCNFTVKSKAHVFFCRNSEYKHLGCFGIIQGATLSKFAKLTNSPGWSSVLLFQVTSFCVFVGLVFVRPFWLADHTCT